MQQKISAIIVIYHEEKVLKRCLESIQDIVDELILIHDGPCRDQSIEIAKSFSKPTRIFVSDHNVGEAEPHRPYSAKIAKYDWLLPIDADEVLSDELKAQIRKIVANSVKNPQNAIDYVRARWPEYDVDGTLYDHNAYKVVLLNKKQTYVLGIPHFKWETYAKSLVVEQPLYHYPIASRLEWKSITKKYIRWAKLQAHFYHSYLLDKTSIPHFQYDYSRFPVRTMFRIKHPILSYIPLIVSNTLQNWKRFKSIPLKERIAKILQNLYYQSLVNYNLLIVRKEKIKPILYEEVYRHS